MNPFLEYSPFNSSKKEKSFVSSSLKQFPNSPLSQFSAKDLKTAKEIWKNIKKPQSKIFIFAFGGAGASAKIANSLFPLKNRDVFLIDKVNKEYLKQLSTLTKTELKSSHSLFISKSGKTEELIFYKSFLKKLYSNKKLSLEGKFTVLTQSENSLFKWAKKEKGSVTLSKNFLPGRFSFFALSGLLQFQAYGCHFKQPTIKNSSIEKKMLEFFIHYCTNKTEIFFCPFNPQLKELAHWLELSWSESLFKQKTKKQAPVLRNVSLPDLRHACIEELISKKNQLCFWSINIKNKETDKPLYEKQLKKLIKTKNIPYLFMEIDLKNKNSIAELILGFYKILFCMGDYFKSDIYIQPWVDYLKSRKEI